MLLCSLTSYSQTPAEIRFLLRQNENAKLLPVQEKRIHELEISNEELRKQVKYAKRDSTSLRWIAMTSQNETKVVQGQLDDERKAHEKDNKKARRKQKATIFVAAAIDIGIVVLLVLF